MNRKIIAIVLVILTLLNCTLPVFAVDETNTETESTELPVKNFELTVEADERQTYEGFGFSMASSSAGLDYISDVDKEKIAQFAYDDLKVEALRLWYNNRDVMVGEDTINLEPFMSRYRNGFLDIAIERGIKLLLAPASGFPDFLKGQDLNDKGEMKQYSAVKPSMADTYAKLLATSIRDLKTEYGVPIYATGIYNEPSDLNADVMALIIPALRRHLDDMGCEDVCIVAPELANNDWRATQFFDYFKERPEAWDNIDMLSTHSYNMSLTEAIGKYTGELESKRFWQTESSITNYDDSSGYGVAITTAARFINDLNHWCTLWMHFQGVSSSNVERTSISSYSTKDRTPEYKKMYWYLKQIIDTYDKGAVFFHTTSDVEGEMEYTYGIKNMIYSATAQNPDGKWAISVINATDTTMCEAEREQGQFRRDNTLQEDTIANVKINILGLSNSGTQKFSVVRSSKNGFLEEVEDVIAENGIIDLTLQPGDLYTLISHNSIEKTEVETEWEEYTEEVMILPDKPDDMTDAQYDLWIQGSKVLGYDESKLPEWTPEYETVVKKRLKSSVGGSVDKHITSMVIGSSVLFVKGERMLFDESDESVAPIIYNGMTYVPVRLIEMLGGTADYDGQTLSLNLCDINVKAKLDKTDVYINDKLKTIKGSIQLIDNRLYIPLRDIAECFGYDLNWDNRGLVTLIEKSELEKLRYSLIDKFEKKLAEKTKIREDNETDSENIIDNPTVKSELPENEKDERIISTAGIDKNIIALMIENPVCFVKGEEYIFDDDYGVYPILRDGVTYVPIRFIEMLGGTAIFDNDNETLNIRVGNFNIESVIGKSHMLVNGIEKVIQGAPTLIERRIYIPLRGLTDNAGMKLYWENNGMIVLTNNVETDGIVQKIIEKFFPKAEAEIVDTNEILDK